jgi:uncharacterized protein (DUF433 family)
MLSRKIIINVPHRFSSPACFCQAGDVVDPHHQFGQPVIENTNLLADTIYSMYKKEEPVKLIARLYEITEKQVADAINFCKQAA